MSSVYVGWMSRGSLLFYQPKLDNSTFDILIEIDYQIIIIVSHPTFSPHSLRIIALAWVFITSNDIAPSTTEHNH
jgi:hypothetical protein